MSPSDPRLYILMRTDIPDLNAGKAVAQGSHAANQCIAEAAQRSANTLSRTGQSTNLPSMIKEWESQTAKGFGTTLVLGVDEATLYEVVRNASTAGLHTGITHDPTYPTGMPARPSPGGTALMLGASMGAWAVLLLALSLTNLALLAAIIGATFFFGGMSLEIGAGIKSRMKGRTIPVNTCGYVFGTAAECKPIVGTLPLMA